VSLYQDYIAISRYARYLPENKRRETWPETVNRFIEFFSEYTGEDLSFLQKPIEEKKVLPSMRAIMTSGRALERDHCAGYNCAYVAVDHVRVFDEALYIMLCGTGLGFSVERQHIAKLPEIAESFYHTDTTIVVSDSKLGWAKALKELVSMLYSGQMPKIDTSNVRPAGAPLKVFGGRASGPEPLERMFKHFMRVFENAAGRKLNSIEVHDLICYQGEAVLVGGVRRTALISLSNHSDERMRNAKSGQWWVENPQRALANNSICYTEQPDVGAFMREWLAIYESRSGERGLFNREACRSMLPERREGDHDFGTNPCSEIVLRSAQFCNLSEVVCRHGDTLESLKKKVEHATILGTVQSSLTDFRYLRSIWRKNCEEERLLGVSLTGIYDCPFLMDCTPAELSILRDHAIKTNRKWAKKLGINPSTAVTCVKPSGTVSQLASCSSGIHPAYNRYYIRRVRNDKKDPLAQVMIDAGIPCEEDKANPEAWVFSFPMMSEGLTRKCIGPIKQLEVWLKFALHWCEHKPSMTCYMGEKDWPTVGSWVWSNFDVLNGVSFLPSADDGHVYEQAPYEDLDSLSYSTLKEAMPKEIDFSFEEAMDNTTASQELACTAGVCEI
jgi:ribonucleoside-diphosphate reductase alpha chain